MVSFHSTFSTGCECTELHPLHTSATHFCHRNHPLAMCVVIETKLFYSEQEWLYRENLVTGTLPAASQNSFLHLPANKFHAGNLAALDPLSTRTHTHAHTHTSTRTHAHTHSTCTRMRASLDGTGINQRVWVNQTGNRSGQVGSWREGLYFICTMNSLLEGQRPRLQMIWLSARRNIVGKYNSISSGVDGGGGC